MSKNKKLTSFEDHLDQPFGQTAEDVETGSIKCVVSSLMFGSVPELSFDEAHDLVDEVGVPGLAPMLAEAVQNSRALTGIISKNPTKAAAE